MSLNDSAFAAHKSQMQTGMSKDSRNAFTGVIPITNDSIKKKILSIPVFKKIHPVVQRYLMQMPHARLERYDKDQVIEMEDANFKLDFIYVLKGGLQIDLELD